MPAKSDVEEFHGKKMTGFTVTKGAVISRGLAIFRATTGRIFPLQATLAFTPLRITGALKTADKTRASHFSIFRATTRGSVLKRTRLRRKWMYRPSGRDPFGHLLFMRGEKRKRGMKGGEDRSGKLHRPSDEWRQLPGKKNPFLVLISF